MERIRPVLPPVFHFQVYRSKVNINDLFRKIFRILYHNTGYSYGTAILSNRCKYNALHGVLSFPGRRLMHEYSDLWYFQKF